MAKKFIIIILCLSIFTTLLPRPAFGLTVPDDIGTGDETKSIFGFSCIGPWTKIICVVKKISDYMSTIRKITKALDYVPHFFPFGGPILSSERACEISFRAWTWIPNPFFAIPPYIGGFIPISIPLTGRAIEVGPPIPTNGTVIAFPWISKIFRNHTENRAGPWALGLGFTPFPLEEINDLLKDITIWIPPRLVDQPCFTGFLGPSAGECIDNIHFDCLPSGDTDPDGNEVYKVIRLLGTSKQDVPAEVLSKLKIKYPTFPW